MQIAARDATSIWRIAERTPVRLVFCVLDTFTHSRMFIAALAGEGAFVGRGGVDAGTGRRTRTGQGEPLRSPPMPRLPDADDAIIPEQKLRDYLLSPTHPVGRYKAAWLAGLGCDAADWSRLATDLREQHLVPDAEPAGANAFGRKYRIEAQLVGPLGIAAPAVSIWMVGNSEAAPRLVTLYPGPTS